MSENNNNQVIDFEELFKDYEQYDQKKKEEKNPILNTNSNIMTILLYTIFFFLGLAGALVSVIVANVSKKSPSYVTLSKLVDTNNDEYLALISIDDFILESEKFKNNEFYTISVSIPNFDNPYYLVSLTKNEEKQTFLINEKDKIVTNDVIRWPSTNEGLTEGPVIGIYYSNTKTDVNQFKDYYNFINAGNLSNLKMSLVQFFSYIVVLIPMFLINFKEIKVDFIDFKKNDSPIISRLLTGFAYMIAVNFVLGLATNILGSFFNGGTQSINQNFIEQLLKSHGAAFMLITIGVFAPIVEELVFRKAIFGLIKNDKTAIIVSSLTFGLLHVTTEIINLVSTASFGIIPLMNVLVLSLPYVGMGFFLGYWYSRNNRNITLLIGMHAISNIFSGLLILL